jgi:hypothetical protein
MNVRMMGYEGRRMCVAVAHVVVFAGLFAQSVTPVQAAPGWNPGQQVKDAADRAVKSVKKEGGNAAESFQRAKGTTYRFKIDNHTSRNVGYSLHWSSAESNQPQIPLKPHQVRSHKVTSLTRPVISFDNGHGQTVRKSMHSGQTYEFVRTNGVIKLMEVRGGVI